MPKKPPASAYFFFMLDFKRREEQRGRKFPRGLDQVKDEASAEWQAMSEAEKQRYKHRAKESKLEGKFNQKVEKLSSQGIPLSAIEKEQKSEEKSTLAYKKDISDTIRLCYMDDTLATQKFHFIAANYFVMHRGIYYPAEISISEFSLKAGISNRFHSFVNPGALPLGTAYEAKEHSEATHKLERPPAALGESDFIKLFQDIVKFILAKKEDKEIPPLYTNKYHIPVIKSVISQLCQEADEDMALFRIYPLDELFFNLKNACVQYGQKQEAALPSVHVAQAILERDQYDYRAGISCDFHEENDSTKFCTLSIVQRWCFIFADYICLDLAITPIEGLHVPVGTDTSMMSRKTRYDDDDTGSFVSKTESNSSASTLSHVTIPGYEQHHQAIKKEPFKLGSDFPSLGAVPKRNKAGPSKDCLSNGPGESTLSGDLNYTVANPWAERSAHIPRKPASDSFSFASVPSGLGRGLAAKYENN